MPPPTPPRRTSWKGFAAYDRRDLAAARRLLSAPASSEPLETLRRIYLGSALAWIGDYAETAALLGSVKLDEVPEPLRGEARVCLYAAWVGAGRKASADSLLRLLRAEPGEIGERARRVPEGR